MAKIIRNFLEGIGQVLIIAPGREYVRPLPNEFKRDRDRLRGDARAVFGGMRKKIKQANDDKSANYC